MGLTKKLRQLTRTSTLNNQFETLSHLGNTRRKINKLSTKKEKNEARKKLKNDFQKKMKKYKLSPPMQRAYNKFIADLEKKQYENKKVINERLDRQHAKEVNQLMREIGNEVRINHKYSYPIVPTHSHSRRN